MSYDSRVDTYQHIAEVRTELLWMAQDLIERANRHDGSKLREPELAIFDEFTPKLRETTYGSDEYKGYLEQMGEALKHHYEENDHHPEHYEDGIADMGLPAMTEMLCDWMAATRRHNDGDIRSSVEKNAERFGYGEEIKRLLHNTLDGMGIPR